MEENNLGQDLDLNLTEQAEDMGLELSDSGVENLAEPELLPIEDIEDSQREESDMFAPEDITFDDIEHTVDGFNLSKYKDVLNFEEEEGVAAIQAEIKKVKAKGYSQKEAEIYIDAKLEMIKESEQERKEETMSRAEVSKLLSEKLNREEKANYKPILNTLREKAEVLGLSPDQISEAMSNPILIKLMNTFYSGSTKGAVSTAEVKSPVNRTSLDYSAAMKAVQDKIMKGSSREEIAKYAQTLENSVKSDQLDEYRTTYKRVFGL